MALRRGESKSDNVLLEVVERHDFAQGTDLVDPGQSEVIRLHNGNDVFRNLVRIGDDRNVPMSLSTIENDWYSDCHVLTQVVSGEWHT